MQNLLKIVRGHRAVLPLVVAMGVVSIASIALADINFEGFKTSVSSNVTITEITIAKPDLVAEGDLLLAGIAVDGGSPATITPPSGWSLIARTDNDTNVGIESYQKIAGTLEPTSYTWTITPQSRAVGGITRYSGVSVSNPIDASAGNIGRGTTATTSSITTTVANAKIVALFAIDYGIHSNGYFTPPTGMAERYDTAKTPFGPSVTSNDATQVAEGNSGIKSSNINTVLPKNWVSQLIALRPSSTSITDDFNSYSDGELNGGNGGTGWATSWSGSPAYQIQGAISYEGAKALKVDVLPTQEPVIVRTFSPKTSGTLHWVQRKDAPDHGSNVYLYSGGTPVTSVSIGGTSQPQAGGPDWFMQDGFSTFIIQPYTVGTFDTVDMQFDTATDQYRASINGGTYTGWKNFINSVNVNSVDTLRIELGATGNDVGPNYWDDIRLTAN